MVGQMMVEQMMVGQMIVRPTSGRTRKEICRGRLAPKNQIDIYHVDMGPEQSPFWSDMTIRGIWNN